MNLVGVAGALHIRDTAHLAFIVANTAACVYSGAVKVYRQHELRYRRFLSAGFSSVPSSGVGL